MKLKSAAADGGGDLGQVETTVATFQSGTGPPNTVGPGVRRPVGVRAAATAGAEAGLFGGRGVRVKGDTVWSGAPAWA